MRQGEVDISVNPEEAAVFAPLDGVRVLDFSKILAGPLCTQHLADLGAEVIKVEPVVVGDDTRHWPPFEGGEGAIFLAVNRNKRSLALDLKSPAGLEACRTLARRCDVVVESFGPGVAERLGVGYAALAEGRPDLIYASISGYGTQGPMREGKGYDLIAQAFTGMLSMTGEPGGPPARSPFSPVDQGAGLQAVAGILAALFQRERTGRGARIETSLFDTAVGFLGYFLQSYWCRGTEPVRPGSGHESLCPYQAFDTRDAPIILGVANDALWRRFCELAGVRELAADPRFATGADRVANREVITPLVADLLRTRTRAEWLGDLERASIPCSPVHTLGELSRHPHTHASGMILHDPAAAEAPAFKAVATPLRVDGDRLAMRSRPPRLGEHSRALLAEGGLDAAEIEALVQAGVVGVGPAPAPPDPTTADGAKPPPKPEPAHAGATRGRAQP